MEDDGDAVKQTSDRVSRIAARVIGQLKAVREMGRIKNLYDDGMVQVKLDDVWALAGSVLTQDETRGPRKPSRIKSIAPTLKKVWTRKAIRRATSALNQDETKGKRKKARK